MSFAFPPPVRQGLLLLGEPNVSPVLSTIALRRPLSPASPSLSRHIHSRLRSSLASMFGVVLRAKPSTRGGCAALRAELSCRPPARRQRCLSRPLEDQVDQTAGWLSSSAHPFRDENRRVGRTPFMSRGSSRRMLKCTAGGRESEPEICTVCGSRAPGGPCQARWLK